MGYQRRVHGEHSVFGNQSDNFLPSSKSLTHYNTQMKTPVIVISLVAVASSKFCPGERAGNKCAAGDNSYKCAVFFENLTPGRPLTWIGALPDALKKATSQEEVRDILGADVTQRASVTCPRVTTRQLTPDVTPFLIDRL